MQTFKMNKSFPQSPTASSETSETQSINDEPINRKVFDSMFFLSFSLCSYLNA